MWPISPACASAPAGRRPARRAERRSAFLVRRHGPRRGPNAAQRCPNERVNAAFDGASPPAQRKGCAFPAHRTLSSYSGRVEGYAFHAARMTFIGDLWQRKGRAFPHSKRRSRGPHPICRFVIWPNLSAARPYRKLFLHHQQSRVRRGRSCGAEHHESRIGNDDPGHNAVRGAVAEGPIGIDAVRGGEE